MMPILILAFLLACAPFSFAGSITHPGANPVLNVPPAWGVSVEAEGAIGDGVRDDTANIRQAITKAGVGGTVLLSPNKTYLVSDELLLSIGQRMEGSGATLKRAPQVTTTTTASIATGGATTVTVANASVFAVGDQISFSVEDHAAAPTTNHYSAKRAIAAIDTGTNTITLASSLAIGAASTGDLEAVLNGSASEGSYTFASGAVVAKVYALLHVQTRGALHNVIIDGGWKDGAGVIQQPVAHWDLFEELVLSTATENNTQMTVENVTVKNFSSEAIVELSSDPYVTAVYASPTSTSIRYLHVTIKDGAGNGIHTSGEHNDIVDGMFCFNINQYLGVGHIGGCNTLSFTGQHLVVRDSYMDTAYAGLFNAELNNNSNIVFTGNVVKNMFRAGFEANGRSTNAQYGPSSLIVSKNIFINCRLVFRSNAATGTGLLSDVIVEGNTLSGTQLQIDYAKQITVRNNIIRNDFVVPSSVALARTYTDTTAVVASGASYYVGQRVFLAKSGSPMARSRDLTISNVAGATITFSHAIGVTAADNIPAGAYLYDARRTPMIETASGTVTTGDLTVTVPDASLFTVNQWFVVSSTSSGTPATPVHIRAINYVTNVLTVGTAISQTYTAVNLQFWAVGFSPYTNTPITVLASAVGFTDNTVMGGNGGIYLAGDCTGMNISRNTFLGQRSTGIFTSADTVTSSELVSHNIVSGLAGFSSSCCWIGVQVRSAAQAIGNVITTIAAGNKGVYVNAGTKPVIVGNVIKGPSTVPLDITAGVTTPYLAGNYLLGAAGITDASVSPAYGIATVTAAATTVVVTHNLGYAPNVANISVTPTLLSLSKSWWISGITATQFTINVDVVPGAGTATFSWSVLR